jgi:hypothetical protein
MERLFNDCGVEVTVFFQMNRSTFVETKSEAEKLTSKVGYFYPVFDKNKKMIGYGIPK